MNEQNVFYLVSELNVYIKSFRIGCNVDDKILKLYGHSGIVHTIIKMYFEDIIYKSDIDELINDCLNNMATYYYHEFISRMED